MTSMHDYRFFGGIALLAISATGCGLATASTEQDVIVPADPTMIDFVDPSAVVGLVARTLPHTETADRYVHASYPQLRNAPALDEALHREAERQVRTFTHATANIPRTQPRTDTPDDAPAAPSASTEPAVAAERKSEEASEQGDPVEAGPPHPELNMDWQLAAASDQIVGVRLRTSRFLGTDWGHSLRTIWYDARTGMTVGSPGLLKSQTALQDVAKRVRDQLTPRGPQVDRAKVTGDGFDSMAFNRAGDLVVEFDDCQIAACSLGRLAVALPAATVTPLLSPTGQRAQDAVRAAAKATEAVTPSMPPMPGRSPVASSSRAGTVNCAQVKCIALTFDDGPGPQTARLLDLLKLNQARATFFTVGSCASARPDLLRRMSAEGHLVADHTWSHEDLSKLATSKIADTLGRTDDMVTAAIGQTPTLLRPPYGAVSEGLTDVARAMGLSIVTWDVDTEDERYRDPKAITERAVSGAHPGAIVLMHDVQKSTVDAIPGILKQLRGKGYTFVTVPELYGTVGMQAGRLYKSG
jgi:peptidoglycan/xylan/chitin deacetylase (PgdA/CDA1 family)